MSESNLFAWIFPISETSYELDTLNLSFIRYSSCSPLFSSFRSFHPNPLICNDFSAFFLFCYPMAGFLWEKCHLSLGKVALISGISATYL